MRKVYLYSGHSNTDPGAIGNGFKEADLTKEFRDLIKLELEKLGTVIIIDSDSDNLNQVINKTKSNDTDIICDIHFNSSINTNATGTEVIIPTRNTDIERRLAKEISNKISEVLQIRNRGVKTEADTARGRLAIMQTKGINILLEICFISNKSDIDKYQKHKSNLSKELSIILNKYIKQ